MFHILVPLREALKKYVSINDRLNSPRGSENRNELTEPPYL